MGVYSTRTINRSYVIEKIISLLQQATNDELSNALFQLTCDHCLDNYDVLNDDEYEEYRKQNPQQY